ncbi:SGNH/GDSL hydrolase family protein [Plantactinospora sonchi]|uniref:SGNH hydrolase-type esterase domain-containing protein n=1 Tax=Plantactinospora sonchi TaxID=1544735 RepID=A0ABU7RSH0_9ACTN
MPRRWGVPRPPADTARRPARSRRARAAVLAVAAGLVGTLIVASPGLAIPPTPDVPIGEEPPPPPPTRPALIPAPGTLEKLAELAEQVACPSGNGPVAPWQGTAGVTPRPQQRVVRIVIVGDSYMSGEGAGDYLNKRGVIPPPYVRGPVNTAPLPAPGYTQEDYNADWRHRSRHAAALLAIDELRKANPDVVFDVVFNASSGAETKHFWTAQSDEGRNNPPQNAGINNQTNLVVVGMGGNDAGFGPLVEHALRHNDQAGLQSLAAQRTALLNPRTDDVEWADANSAQPASLVSRYIKMVRAIHTQGPNTRVMMVTYPQGLTRRDIADGVMGVLLAGYEYEVLVKLAPQISDAIRRAQQILTSKGVQVDLLDIRNAFAGHTLGTDDPWVNGLVYQTGSGSLFNRLQETAHPNRRGTQALSAHYAKMIATELGVRPPPTGARPNGGVTQPCRPGLPPPSTGGGGSGSGGGGSGSGGGGSGGGGSPGTPPGGGPPPGGGDYPGPGVPPPGGDDGDSGDNGWGDIDPIAPTDPQDPYIPDGLEGPFPTLPTNPNYGNGGEPPMDAPLPDANVNYGPGWKN